MDVPRFRWMGTRSSSAECCPGIRTSRDFLKPRCKCYRNVNINRHPHSASLGGAASSEDWPANCGSAPNLLQIWLGLLDRQRWAVRSNQRRPFQAAASNPANFCLSRSTQQHHSQVDAESHTKTITRQPDNSSTITEIINSQHNHLAAAQLPPPWRTIPTEVGPALRIFPTALSKFLLVAVW